MSSKGVPALLKELKTKIGAFTRCFHEYGTYLQELEQDEELLRKLEAEGRETKQQKAVIGETSSMIPLTKIRTNQMADALTKFWDSQKSPLEKGIAAGTAEEQVKWKKELSFNRQQLSKTLDNCENEKNPLLGEPAEKRIKGFSAALETMSKI